jgi:hypothetical protein
LDETADELPVAGKGRLRRVHERRHRLAAGGALLPEPLEVDDVGRHENPFPGEGGFEDHDVVLGGQDRVLGHGDAVDAEGAESLGDAGREHLVEQ